MPDNTIALLEAWQSGHKNRSVEITHDDGYGASCWVVVLRQGDEAVTVCEIGLPNGREGLDATILAVLERVVELSPAMATK